MIYLPEDYYWVKRNFSFDKAILLTITQISQSCKYYEAKILDPKKGVEECIKKGELPKNKNEKEEFIKDLYNWIVENSTSDWYQLVLSDIKDDNILINPKFSKYEGLDCCWELEISAQEFDKLKKIWKENNLPEDLFYDQNKSVVTIPKYYEKWSKLRRILFGGTYSFSPKVWEMMKKVGKDKNYIIQKQNNSV